MKIIVTGGCGFIGANFILHMLETDPQVSLVNLDLLTYAGNLENLQDASVYKDRYKFVKADIANRAEMEDLFTAEAPDAVVNFAAESHVDRSIIDSGAFVRTNVMGAHVLLELSRSLGVPRFVQISTDEVYGSLDPDEPPFTEERNLAPNSPYAASKASADLLVRSYVKTHSMDALITRCSNNYGPYQFPEKLIPLMITNAFYDQELPVYGDGLNVRDWIYVKDHCRAIDLVLRKGEPGEIYNIGADYEATNLEIVKSILELLDKPDSLIRMVKDRPGHDRRYAMDSTKLESALGWKPEVSFKEGLARTVSWYLEHEQWWKRIKSGEYMEYYETWYMNR
jgi:dTDP-glucose 4,6-dehydratase